MSSCPTCQRKYYDETIRFCLDDGSPLVAEGGSARSGDETWHLPNPTAPPAPTVRSTQPAAEQRSTLTSFGEPQPPGSASPAKSYPGERRHNAALLFVLGAVIIGIAAVAVAFIATRNRGQDANADPTASASPAPTATDQTSAPASDQTQKTSEPVDTESKASTTKDVPTPAQRQATANPIATAEPQRTTARDEPPPAKPAPTQAAPRAPISGGVLNGKATNLVKPAYPPIAKSVRASGQVTVQVTIDEQGNVISARAVSGHPLLQQSAVSAARSSKFSPTKLSGQPVKVTGVIIYNFVSQ